MTTANVESCLCSKIAVDMCSAYDSLAGQVEISRQLFQTSLFQAFLKCGIADFSIIIEPFQVQRKLHPSHQSKPAAFLADQPQQLPRKFFTSTGKEQRGDSAHHRQQICVCSLCHAGASYMFSTHQCNSGARLHAFIKKNITFHLIVSSIHNLNMFSARTRFLKTVLEFKSDSLLDQQGNIKVSKCSRRKFVCKERLGVWCKILPAVCYACCMNTPIMLAKPTHGASFIAPVPKPTDPESL